MFYYLNQYIEKSDLALNIFDFLWFLRAVNDAYLAKNNLKKNLIREMITLQLKHIDLNQKGHPIDLILRELALYEFNSNNKSLALRYIKRSKKTFDLEDSEIAKWLKSLIDIHADYINGEVKDGKNYFSELQGNEFVGFVCNDGSISLIERVRNYSPY